MVFSMGQWHGSGPQKHQTELFPSAGLADLVEGRLCDKNDFDDLTVEMVTDQPALLVSLLINAIDRRSSALHD